MDWNGCSVSVGGGCMKNAFMKLLWMLEGESYSVPFVPFDVWNNKCVDF